jgi:hypothetical protein
VGVTKEDAEKATFEDKLKKAIDKVYSAHNPGAFNGMVNGVMDIIYPPSEEKELIIDLSEYDRAKLEVKVEELYEDYKKLFNIIRDLESRILLGQIYVMGKYMGG